MNILIGHNGAGKTSILEAISLLGSGRSFRGGAKTPVVQNGAAALSVFAEVHDGRSNNNLGFSRNEKSWQGRINGVNANTLGELVRLLPVLVLEPGTHELVEGGSESRRKMLDWLLFHVEPGFSGLASRYQRILKQRNAALKVEDASADSLSAWDQALAETGQQVAELRAQLWSEVKPHFSLALSALLPELGLVNLGYQKGWPDDMALLDSLQARHSLDLGRGFTSRGPHRADWAVEFALAQDKAWLSRGQEKCVFIAFAVALLKTFQARRGQAAILCIDDLFSELDVAHQARCFPLVESCVDQLWISGTEQRDSVASWLGERALFHVEQGRTELQTA